MDNKVEIKDATVKYINRSTDNYNITTHTFKVFGKESKTALGKLIDKCKQYVDTMESEKPNFEWNTCVKRIKCSKTNKNTYLVYVKEKWISKPSDLILQEFFYCDLELCFYQMTNPDRMCGPIGSIFADPISNHGYYAKLKNIERPQQ